jgi:hypothetical protein
MAPPLDSGGNLYATHGATRFRDDQDIGRKYHIQKGKRRSLQGKPTMALGVQQMGLTGIQKLHRVEVALMECACSAYRTPRFSALEVDFHERRRRSSAVGREAVSRQRDALNFLEIFPPPLFPTGGTAIEGQAVEVIGRSEYSVKLIGERETIASEVESCFQGSRRCACLKVADHYRLLEGAEQCPIACGRRNRVTPIEFEHDASPAA